LIARDDLLERLDVAAAVDEARRLGVDLAVFSPADASELQDYVVRVADAGARRIVAGGGDGTINAVADTILSRGLSRDVSLGILPLGTGNDFAKIAGIDASNLAGALATACTGAPTRIDVGQMNGRYFVNAASAGFGAEVTATTPQDLKDLLGPAAYSIMGLVKAFQFEPHDGRLVFSDGTVEESRFLVMAACNGRFAGGGFDLAPRARLNDGLLDVTLVAADAPDPVNLVLNELSDPAHPENEHVLYRQVSGLEIKTERPLHVTLDGEATTGSEFEFRCCPDALSVVLGEAYEET